MKVNLSSPKITLLFSLIICLSISSFAAVDDFERGNGPLGSNWAANTNMVILDGRLHNQGATAGWDSYLAVFNVEGANEATITWPTAGDGISGVGAQLGGVAFLNSFSAGNNGGYLVYVYSNEIRLFEISNGSPIGDNIQPDVTTSVNPGPGDQFTVKFNTSTYTFTVLRNGSQIGSIKDSAKRVPFATSYAGIMLYKSSTNENDVEAFEAKYVAPSNDTTSPAKISNLAAGSPTSSSITLTWTAVGDDGTSGTATSYDIRRSKNNILSETDFNSATRVTGPAPKAAGANESFAVSGLEASTKYYFAIKAGDEAGNWGAMSNVPSETTTEGGGGGSNTGQLVWKTDEFERADLGPEWDAPNYKIDQGELTLTNKINGWNNLALYQSPGAYGVAMTFSSDRSALYNGAYVPAGLLILMDNANPVFANGYLLKRVANAVDIFRVTSGTVGSDLVLSKSTTLSAPQPGEKVEATIVNKGATKTITVYVRGQQDVAFTLNDASPMENTYVGVALFGGAGFSNNLESFAAGFPGGSGAQEIVVYGGNNQSGPIQTQLPLPIAVLVTDENEQPAAGTLLDFQLIQGQVRFDDIEDFQFEGQVWQEVEAGRLLQPNARVADDQTASGEQYVTYDWVTGQTRRKAVAVPFYVPEAGRYDLWVRSRTDNSSNYKFYYSLDTSSDSVYVEMPRNYLNSWVWVRIDNNVPINVGMHDLNLIPYHAELKWDKILVQKVGSGSDPSGIGGSGPVFPNMTDESGIGSTKVTFGTDADTSVIVYVYAYRNDGSRVEEPAVFTLDPQPGSAVAMVRDPAVPEPVLATPGFESPELRIIIMDSFDNRVEGVSVNWRVSQGDGTLASATTVTNASGVAANTMLLNFYQETDYKVQASVVGLTGSPVTFTIEPGEPPRKIVKIGPKTRQEGNVNTIVDSVLTVRILKADDTPFENYPVEFTVTQGNGVLNTQGGDEDASTLDIATDMEGYARAVWTLGGPGLNVVEARAENLQGSPVQFEAWAKTGQPAKFEIVSGDDQNGYAGLPLPSPFIVRISDSNGYPISERQVDFEIISGQGAYFDQAGIIQKTAYTNPSGEAKVTLTLGGVLNEEHVVRATAFNTGLPSVFFHATPTDRIAKTLKYISGNGASGVYQSGVVTSKLKQPFIVKAEDPYGFPAANQPVTFKVLNGGGSFDGASEVTRNTDTQGQASVTLTLGTLAGDSVHIVHVMANRIDIPGQALDGSPIVFKATGLPKAASRLVKVDSTDAQTGEVGLPLSSPLQVKVTDEHYNPINNHTVTFAVRNNAGELEDSAGKSKSKVVRTGKNGVASVIWHMPNTPGVVYTDVTANKTTGGPLENSPMEFSAMARQGTPHTMTRITPDSVLIGTVWKPLPEKLVIKITDRLGNSLSGIPVKFEVTEGGGLLNGLPQVVINTNDTGFAEVVWQIGRKSGVAVNTVQASASVAVNPLITFKATGLPDAAFRLVADSSYTTYGVVGAFLPDPVKVKIVDQYGNGVAQQTVDFEIVPVGTNAGYINQPGQTAARDTTDKDGFVQVRWGLGPEVGSQNNKMRATAKLNQVHLVNSPYVFSASAMVGGADQLIKVTNDSSLSSIIGNTLSEYLKVRIIDSYDNPVANVPVRFQVLSRNEAQGGTLDGTIDTLKTKPTDSNGFAWVQFTLGQKAGYKINKVEARAENPATKLPLKGSPVLFEITGTSTNARKIKLADGGGQKGSVGDYLPRAVSVTAVDRYDNPVRNQPIRFRIVPNDTMQMEWVGSLGPGSAVDTSVNTNAQGFASIQWRLGRYIGRYTLEASSFGNGHLENSPLLIYASGKAGKTNPDTSLVRVNPAELLVSNGEIKSTVIVTLRDQFGNPVSGKAVNIQVSGDGNLITQPMDTTNVRGEATGYLASRVAGEKYITARDMNSGISLRDSLTSIVFRPAAAAAITKAPENNGDTQKRNTGTVLEYPLKVLVTDRFGNAIPNVPVTFRAISGGGTLVDNQPVLTDSMGISAAKYRLGLQAGANLIEASSAGLSGSPVNFSALAENPQQLSRLEILGGNLLSAPPGQELPEPLRVRVLDVRNWPVFGKSTRFDVLVNDAVVTSQNPINSDMYGEAHASVKIGTTVGLNLIKAYLQDLPSISATFYDTTKVKPGSGASSIQQYAGNNQTGYVGQTLAVPLTIRVVDPYSNPVPNVTVKFQVVDDQTVEGSGVLEGGIKALSKQSNALGLTQAYYTLGQQSGLNRIRVSVPTLDQVFTDFVVYGTASTAHQMRKWSGDNQTGEMDRVLLKPISVLVTDQYGNPARGGTITFVILAGGGTILEPQPILSGVNGIAQVHWRLGPRPNAYVNQVQCVAELPGGTFIETFNATGDPSHWPQLQLPGEKWVAENDVVSFNVHATDSDNPPVLCAPEKMPDSTAAFVDNGNGTWTFSWRPNFNVVNAPAKTKDVYAVFKATDTKGGMDIDSVKIIVQNKNRLPQITRFWPETSMIYVEPGSVSNIDFGVNTYDPDDDVLTVSWLVDGTEVGYGKTWSMDLSRYPAYKYYDINVRVIDTAGGGAYNYWGLKVPVELTSFTTDVTPYEGVKVKWETGVEYGNTGFHVLRSLKEDGEYARINEKLIPSNPQGQYEYSDSEIAAGRTYYYKLENVNVDGSTSLHGPVKAEAPVPKDFKLAQNFPNPFNPATTMRFDLPQVAQVKLEIYNVLGQKVRTLIDREMQPGYHEMIWDSKNDVGMRVASGVYYYRLIAGDFQDVKKMALLK
ncbi:Ig-like domain-containing protein [candidate division KSB1 bacterium]|nr:Ig-like domain-containing protein [candidate division KSB1 bacterium]